MDTQYTTLSKLVNDTFIITGCKGWTWKKWDNENKKMLLSMNWAEGYRKMFTFITSKGQLDLSEGQVGQILARAFNNKELSAKLSGAEVAVKSNGKTGMDIRYFLSIKGYTDNVIQADPEENDINVEEIPW